MNLEETCSEKGATGRRPWTGGEPIRVQSWLLGRWVKVYFEQFNNFKMCFSFRKEIEGRNPERECSGVQS